MSRRLCILRLSDLSIWLSRRAELHLHWPPCRPVAAQLKSQNRFAETLHHYCGQSSRSSGRLLTEVCKKKNHTPDTLAPHGCYVTKVYRWAGETSSDVSLRGWSFLSDIKNNCIDLDKNSKVSYFVDSWMSWESNARWRQLKIFNYSDYKFNWLQTIHFPRDGI